MLTATLPVRWQRHLLTLKLHSQLHLGDILCLKTRWFQAQDFLEELIEEYPNDPRPWEKMGDFHLSQRQPCEAVLYYKEALNTALQPQNEGHLRRLTQLMEKYLEASHRCANPDTTLELCYLLFDEVAQQKQRVPIHYLKLGYCLQHCTHTDPQLVLGLYEKGIAEFPFDYLIPAMMGQYCFQQGDLTGAICGYQMALQQVPDDLHLWAELAGLHLLDDYNIKAFRFCVNKVIQHQRLGPKQYVDHYFQGLIHFFKNNKALALNHYGKSRGLIGPYYQEAWGAFPEMEKVQLVPFWTWD
jgi:tetratricopeptide (TPR) repeat protein